MRRIDAEEIECLSLSGRWGRDQFEAFGSADGDVVQNDGREIGEQGMEAVHGRRVRRVSRDGASFEKRIGGF